MRSIETSAGQTIEVRGLTRAEIRRLKEKGLAVNRWGFELDPSAAPEKAAEMMDAILPVGTNGDFKADEMTPRDERKIFLAIAAETWGSADEEKN